MMKIKKQSPHSLPVLRIVFGELVSVSGEEPHEWIPHGEEGEGCPQEGLPRVPSQRRKQPLHSLVYCQIYKRKG